MMRGWIVRTTVVACFAAALVLAPDTAIAALASQVELAAPSQGYVGEQVAVGLTLVSASTPISGAAVEVQRFEGGDWNAIATVTTNGAGSASASVSVLAGASANTLRAFWPGDPTHDAAVSQTVVVKPLKRDTVLTLTGPDSIVDETSVTLSSTWVTSNGRPVPGSALVEVASGDGDWKPSRKLTYSHAGTAQFTVSPRVSSRWRITGQGGTFYLATRSPVKKLVNLPPGKPVRLPARAPAPSLTLPAQARAVGSGANAVISGVGSTVWSSMVGRTWHRGCPVGRRSLRLVRINYWGFDGYRHRGELVVNKGIAAKTVTVFTTLYDEQLPIRSMYREDRFGWSRTLHGANDYRSMRADNTSAFNCRGVVGNPSVRSPHSTGRAIDINTWENPYNTGHGILPNSWWLGHSNPRYAWRSSSHAVVRAFLAAGFRWTYGLSDTQHFDG